jgi:phage FluMu gp28-like protein
VFRRVVEAATATRQAEPVAGHRYAMGVDWGKHNDFTVLTLIDLDERATVDLDRFNQIDYQVQLGRLTALYERFRPITIVAERNSMGEPLIEQLQRQALPVTAFNTTNATKTQVIEGLALAFERGDLRILRDQTLIAELQAYEMERLPSGLVRYGAPEGMHDDMVMSLALAWTAVVFQPAVGSNPFYDF